MTEVGLYRRPRRPLAPEALAQPHGLPLKCPKCSPANYYGKLKLPGEKAVPCPNCETELVRAKPRRTTAHQAKP